MRTLSAVCMLALILGSFATTNYKVIAPMNLKPARNMVNVLTQVEAMMTSGGPIEMVHDVLNEFENEITSEQSAHDGLNEQASTECEREADFRRREVNDATATLREATATYEGCVDQHRRANSDLKSAEGALLETRDRLRILGERREAEAAQFASDQATYEFNSANIAEVVEFLESLLEGEGEFEELAQLGQKLMRGAIKSNKVEHFGNTFAVLATLASKGAEAEAELFEQARNIFVNLGDSLDEAWEARIQVEDELIASGERETAAANGIVAELEAHIQNLNIEITNLHRCEVEQSGVINSATAKRDRNQRLWDDSQELCGSQGEFYEQAKNQRREERDIIDAVRQKVELRWGTQ
jgi:chromosome segregation ATPase